MQAKEEEKLKDNIWAQEKKSFVNPDEEAERQRRQQAILRQHLAEEAKKQGMEVEDYDEVRAEHDEKRFKETVDSLPLKRKEKWRIW